MSRSTNLVRCASFSYKLFISAGQCRRNDENITVEGPEKDDNWQKVKVKSIVDHHHSSEYNVKGFVAARPS